VVLSSRRAIRSGVIGTIRPASGPPILHHDASWTCRIMPGRQASPKGCHASLAAMPPRQVVAAGWVSPNRQLGRLWPYKGIPGSPVPQPWDRAPLNWVRAGPCRNGRVRAAAVTNGRQWFRGTAGRRPSDSCSWDDASGRFGLWSRRSGIRVRSLVFPIPAADGRAALTARTAPPPPLPVL
jgi:hypothetical protein